MDESHLPWSALKRTPRRRAVPTYLPESGPRRSELIRCSINISLLNECVCETILPFTEIRVPNLLPDIRHSFFHPDQGSRGEALWCMLSPPKEEKKKNQHSDYPVVREFYEPLQLPRRPKCFSLNSYCTCLNRVSLYLERFCFLQDQNKRKMPFKFPYVYQHPWIDNGWEEGSRQCTGNILLQAEKGSAFGLAKGGPYEWSKGECSSTCQLYRNSSHYKSNGHIHIHSKF